MIDRCYAHLIIFLSSTLMHPSFEKLSSYLITKISSFFLHTADRIFLFAMDRFFNSLEKGCSRKKHLVLHFWSLWVA